MAMLRDDSATALKDMPVTLIVKRPDGSEFTRYALALAGSGALYQALPLPKSSRRGRWSVTAHIDPKAAPVGRVEFSVEDFVPEKLKVELQPEAPMLRTNRTNTLNVQADFLYGAPASGLTVEGDLRVDVDPVPFPAFNKYSFGLEAEREKFEPPLITLTAPDTDDKGKSKIEWAGDKVKETALPLRGQVQVRVFEPGNGRATKNDKTLPLRTREVYLGIRPTFEGRYAREGAETEFDLVAVDAEGKQVARPSVDYKIERITYSYQWYQSDGKWRWQSIQAERLVAADTLAFKADAPAHLAKQLSWGPHRLTINDREANTSTSITFYVGWWGGSGTEDAPDSLRVASDKKNYAPGDTAKLRLEAPFAGEALIAIATDRIVATYTTKVPAEGTTVEIPVKAEWGAGAYALVTAWRPLDAPAERTPTRAVGAAWLGLDPALRTLAVQIAAPEKVTPRQRIEVPIRVANAQGPEAYVTLAAVDEGILQLTKYRTPNPADYYFGKRRLGVDMRDDYGRLLDVHADEVGRIRVGGDAGDIGGLDVVPTRTVALFSGPVKLDDKGEAKIGLDIPDFVGQLRLMAVAYDKSKVGSSDARLFVRDAVTADIVLPRFLAPDDRGRVALSLHNVDGQPGDYKVTLEATGSVSLERPVAETHQARRQPARAAHLAAARRRCRPRQCDGRGERPGQFLGQARLGHPGARLADAERRRHGVPARGRPRAHGRSQPHRAVPARHRAGERGAVAHAGHRRGGTAARARQVSLWLHRADHQPRPAAALLQRRGAAGLRAGRSQDHRSRAGGGLPHRRHADDRRLVRHVGAVLLACRRMAAELRARLPAARARPADGGAGGVAAARPDLAQPLGRPLGLGQRPGLCLVRAGQGGPRRCRPRALLPGRQGGRDQGRPRLGPARRGAEPVGEPGRARLAFALARQRHRRARQPRLLRHAVARPCGPAGARLRGRRPRGRGRR